ncbi:MAG: alpha/beta hydrolase [Bacteroidales bacterium]|nr:alpha/beta hydrolase [Bacteroidales bacterium]
MKALKQSGISYLKSGHGDAIILLHGYLESKEIWIDFADDLAKKYTVLAIDLPGHGESELITKDLSLEIMAEAVKTILDYEQIEKCFLVWHSMGGYVALAFLELFPERLDALSLFHSSPYADTDEKRKNRAREMDIIRAGKKAQVYTAHFPKTFAPDNVEKFTDEIKKMNERAKNMSDEGIIAALNAMKNRPDQSGLLKNTKIPIQYIIGEKDNFIPMSILDKLQLPDNSELVVLENSGHMGFIEEKENALRAISGFYA